MHTVTLNNDVEMPILGFGVYQVPPEETQAAVEAALAAGYRHVDTAAAYRNEAAVGAAIAASGIARDELFVTTKLWIQHDPTGRVEDATKRAFASSLGSLGLDRVDLYLIHQPFGDYYAEWRALQDVYAEGAALAIGVSNFHPDRLIDVFDFALSDADLARIAELETGESCFFDHRDPERAAWFGSLAQR